MTTDEQNLIQHFIDRLDGRTTNEIESLIYEWTKTGHLTKLEHRLLCDWHYGRKFSHIPVKVAT